jgi:hypothetical protein
MDCCVARDVSLSEERVSSSRIAVTVEPLARVRSVEAVRFVNVPAAAVEPPIIVPSIAPASMSTVGRLAVPARCKSLNSREDVPMSSVFVVLGATSVELIVKSCTGPTTLIGPPSAAVPSCVCPVDALKALSMASYSPSKSAALITLPSAMFPTFLS